MMISRDATDFLHGVKFGLLRPSYTSVLSMVFLSLLVLWTVFFAQSGLNDRNAHLIAKSPTDHDLFAVAQLKSVDPIDADPLLVIIGASVTRSSFGTNAEIAAAIKARFDADFDVINLCTSRQSILSSIALVDNLPTDRRVLVVFGLGPSRFTLPRRSINSDLRRTRLAISSSAEDEIVKELGLYEQPKTGIEFIDYRSFYMARLVSLAENLVKTAIGMSPPNHNQEQYIGRRKSAKEELAHNKRVASRFSDTESTRALNLDLLDRLITLVESRPNMSLVLVEHPMKPSFAKNWIGRDVLDQHIATMKEVAGRREVPYWTLALDLGLSDENFYDWAHISDNLAQQRLREELAARLKGEYNVE